jgi:murein DD-endopeptidase MepM/ murein hydrolase activator NlpD
MDFSSLISELVTEIRGLFGSKQHYNAPESTQAGTPAPMPSGSFTAPIHDGWASSGGFTYSPNPTHPKGHMGVDMRAPAGTPVYPLAPGVVTNVGTDPMGGNVVNIQHANGVRTYYAHLSVVRVQKGDKVDTNTVIGNVGNTGNASHTFPHLHFQVWVDNQIQDPAKYFSIPVYTNLTDQEKRQGPWLSPEAKQQAEAFSMKEHLEERRVAFSRDVEKLVVLSHNFQKLSVRPGRDNGNVE